MVFQVLKAFKVFQGRMALTEKRVRQKALAAEQEVPEVQVHSRVAMPVEMEVMVANGADSTLLRSATRYSTSVLGSWCLIVNTPTLDMMEKVVQETELE